MPSTAPSAADVAAVVEELAPDGEPLTTPEVAAEFDCSDRTIYNRLDALAADGVVETKKVGAHARVWWRSVRDRTSNASAEGHSFDGNLLDRILETSPIAIVVVEQNGEISLANRRAENVLGLSRDEITNRTYRQPEWNISHEDGTPITAAENPVTRVLRTGEPVYGFEHRIELPDGTERWLSSNSAPLVGPDGDVERVVVGLEDITRQRDRESDIRKQRNELQRLDRVNTVVRSINRAIVSARTRTEIEQAVCAHIAASDPYLFAVVTEFSESYSDFTPRAFAGVGEEHLEQILEGDAQVVSEGARAKSVRTKDVQVVQRLSEPPFDPWSEANHEYGFRSYASIPIVYEDVVYGVLGVYARQPAPFDADEREVLAELGQTVGHAINAIERREALVADTVVELEFRSPEFAAFFEEAIADTDAVGVIDQSVVLDDGDTLQYYTVSGADTDQVRAALEAVPVTERVRVLSESSDRTRLEVRTSGPSLTASLAASGARLSRVSFQDGEARLFVDVPYGRDVREIVDLVQSMYPDSEFASRKTREMPTRPAPSFREAVLEELTDRQQAVLEAAYAAGFFNWPRDSTGDELAESLGVAPPTFHKHLRAGEAKIVAELFGGETDDRHTLSD